MGKPLTIQPEDDERLLKLKKQMGAKSKVEVMRSALDLLEKELLRQQRVERWSRVAKRAAKESLRVNSEFRNPKRFEKLP